MFHIHTDSHEILPCSILQEVMQEQPFIKSCFVKTWQCIWCILYRFHTWQLPHIDTFPLTLYQNTCCTHFNFSYFNCMFMLYLFTIPKCIQFSNWSDTPNLCYHCQLCTNLVLISFIWAIIVSLHTWLCG